MNVENLEITGIVGEEKMELSGMLCQGSWDEDRTEKDPLAESCFPTMWSGSKRRGPSWLEMKHMKRERFVVSWMSH